MSEITPIPAVPEVRLEPTASAGSSSIAGTEQSLLSALEATSEDALVGISPTASFLSHLEMLEEEDPQEFSKVAATIAESLHDDAKTAAIDGDVTQADRLNHVAEVFEDSAKSDKLPTLDALHQAGLPPEQHVAVPASIETIIDKEVTKAIDSLHS